jgi:hypothetical protein
MCRRKIYNLEPEGEKYDILYEESQDDDLEEDFDQLNENNFEQRDISLK